MDRDTTRGFPDRRNHGWRKRFLTYSVDKNKFDCLWCTAYIGTAHLCASVPLYSSIFHHHCHCR